MPTPPQPALAAEGAPVAEKEGADQQQPTTPTVDAWPSAGDLPSYAPVQRVEGTLRSVGSDTMNNLMTLWAEGFGKFHPNATLEVEGKGSSTAPPALIAGTADLAPMSRRMRESEAAAFQQHFGYEPTPLVAAIDMLTVIVHPDNPIAGLTLPQVDAIFSSTRNLGCERDIATWCDAGLGGSWARMPIAVHAGTPASGLFGFFKEHALGRGDFRKTAFEGKWAGSGVAADRHAIGYSSAGYSTASIRAVPLALDAESNPVSPTPENAYSGEYPLTRRLYLYLNVAPERELSLLQQEFLRFVFSQEGQAIVVNDGFLPVTADMAAEALELIGAATQMTEKE